MVPDGKSDACPLIGSDDVLLRSKRAHDVGAEFFQQAVGNAGEEANAVRRESFSEVSWLDHVPIACKWLLPDLWFSVLTLSRVEVRRGRALPYATAALVLLARCKNAMFVMNHVPVGTCFAGVCPLACDL